MGDSITARAKEIETTFGRRWRVWRTEADRWWAARAHTLTTADRIAGCVSLEGSPEELAERVREQDRLSHHLRSRPREHIARRQASEDAAGQRDE